MATEISCSLTPLADAWLAPGFCAFELPVDVSRARSLRAVGTFDVVVLERGTASVVYLADTNDDGVPDSKTTIVTEAGLNHGLALHDGFLYASTAQAVYRWSFGTTEDLAAGNVGSLQVVIDNIETGGHVTRTLDFDQQGRLYVSVGSDRNVDPSSFRSRVRRFVLDDPSLFPIDFGTGEVFADGLRNEVGLAFDRHRVLWGVENSADNLFRDDLGGDIHNENPGDELNRLPEEYAGRHWGYPYCWTEFFLDEPDGQGPGTVWAWPSFLNSTGPNELFGSSLITDETCRIFTMRSELSLQAHSAPLGITFYEYKEERPAVCGDVGAFPKEFDGYAFLAYHGSWNRVIPTGYKVVYVAMDSEGRVVGDAQDLLMHVPPNARWDDGFRPVDVSFDDCGRLLVSSDGTFGRGSKVVRIESTIDPLQPSQSPAPSQTPSASPAPTIVSSSPTSDQPFCFSGDTTVYVLDKGPTKIGNVQIGEYVLAANSRYEAVYSFGHRNALENGEYLQIHTQHVASPRSHTLELSRNHMVFVEGRRAAVPAGTLRVGDKLLMVLGDGSQETTTRVKSIVANVTRQGMYAPFTPSGTIVVNDGVLASTFVALQEDSGDGVLRIGGFLATPWTHQWLAHAFEAPHRLCWRFGGCRKQETRSSSGISYWVYAPMKGSRWLLDQHFVIQSVLLVPVIMTLTSFWVMEMLFVQSWILSVSMLLMVIGCALLFWCSSCLGVCVRKTTGKSLDG